MSFDSLNLSSQSTSVPIKQNSDVDWQPMQKLASVDDSFMDWPIQKSVSDDSLEDSLEDSLDNSFEDSDTLDCKFTFQPRKRKSALNRPIFFDNPLNEVLDIDTENDDIAEISTESDEDFNEFQDTFENYSAPPFEIPSNSSNESVDN